MKRYKLETHSKKILADTLSPVSVYLKIRDKFQTVFYLKVVTIMVMKIVFLTYVSIPLLTLKFKVRV